MALKYYFEFTDVEEILHRCEIYDADFVGDSTEVNGSLELNKSDTEDTLDTIRGGGLKIDLDANLDLTFNDLYSENERTFSVKYIRDSVELFYGWLSPEGLVESFVDDNWVISLDCTDGLGFLKNLSYVENSTGLIFIGKQTMFDIVVNCLKRTNLEQNIFIDIDIWYEGLSTTLNILENAYLNVNRFVKNDGETIMNCDEILRSIFDLFGCCLTQYKGGWYIYKPNQLYDDSEAVFFGYDSDGVALNPTTYTIDFTQLLGSQINGFYPHHVNKNQQMTVDSSIGAYRINYKYGLIKSFIINEYLESTGGVIDEWTINDPTYITIPASERGFELIFGAVGTKVLTSDSFSLVSGNQVTLTSTMENLIPNLGAILGNVVYVIFFKVVLTDGVDTYTLDNTGSWVAGTGKYVTADMFFNYTVLNYSIQSNELPIDGDVYLEVYAPEKKILTTITDPVIYYSNIGLKPSDSQLAKLKGENHDFQTITNPSTKIEKVKEVYNGDIPSEAYVGAIYKTDSITETDAWNRGGLRNVPLLRISGEERMKMYAKPLRVFSGDVYGYVDYLSVVSIDGIDSVLFMPIKYSYDALTNITTLTLKQILNDDIGTDFDGLSYSLSLDYGNVVEPTIVG